MRLLPVWLLLLIPAAAAQVDVNGTVPDETVLDGFLQGARRVVGEAGDVATGAGRGVSSAADAVGSAVVALLRGAMDVGMAAAVATLDGTVLLMDGVALLGAGMAAAAGAGARAGGQVVLSSTGTLGAGLAGTLGWAAGAATSAAVAGIQGVLLMAASYWDAISLLRPAAVPMPVFAATAAAGGAAATGVGGWAGWELLRRWGWVGAAGFTRISDADLLDHPVRGDIFNLIQSTPGIHASHIAREVGAGWGTVTHHLDKLERGRLVTTRRINNQKCYFENGGTVSRQDMAVAGAVKADTAGQIARFVDAHPMTSQKRLAEAIGISAALASFHVKKLTNLGVLAKVRHGKETLLTTTDAFKRLVAGSPAPAVGGTWGSEATDVGG